MPIIVMAGLCLNFNSRAQSQKTLPLPNKQTIVAKVISSTTGEALPGAVIKVTAPSHTTVSNEKGEFILNLSNGNYILTLHYLNYKTRNITIQIPLKEKLIVSMEIDEQSLKEVEINAGYYTVKDRERTGSISRVTAETIGKQPVNNLYSALIGQMSGVHVIQQTGVPGGGFDISIRGQNSLRKNSTEDGNLPFYIIDGTPFIPPSFGTSSANLSITKTGPNPLSTINPNDIESVEVLKDADATAIYGSRGANGVVLITTKKSQGGRMKLDVSVSNGLGKVGSKLNLFNTEQYLQMRKEAFTNDGVTPTTANAPDLLSWDQKRNSDWQKVLIGDAAGINNFQGSLSGGSVSTRYLVSGNYYRESTVFPGDFSYKRKTLHVNLNHDPESQKFKFVFSSTYGLENSGLPSVDLTSPALLLPPNAPDGWDSQGNYIWINYAENPFPLLERKYKKNSSNLINSAIVSYKIAEGIVIKGNFSYNKFDSEEIQTNPLRAYNPARYTSGNTNFYNARSETFLAEPQLSIFKTLKNITLSSLIGATFQKNERKIKAIYADGFPSDDLQENITAASSLFGQRFEETPYNYAALFTRLNLNWEGKYILNLTGRRDGSSRFGPGKQFANFGAIGVAWLLSNERIIQNYLPLLSYGKLRGSYGITGSDQIGDYKYLDLWSPSFNPYDGKTGLVPVGLFKNDYSWEKNKKLEAALELGFVKDRILISMSYYNNRSSNQLIGYSLSPTTGFNSVLSNFPATVQNTGIELELNTKNINGNKIRWFTNLNFTLPRNKLISFQNQERTSYSNILQVGQPLTIRYTGVYQNVDPKTGKYVFSSKQNLSDSGTQQFYGGFQNNLTYQNFELSIHFQFVKQTGANYLPTFYSSPGAKINQPIYVLDRWQNPNDITNIQKFTQNYSSEYGTLTSSDKSVSDASYIRLKNVQLSCQLSEYLIKKMHLQQLKIYVQSQNLFTITNYKGLDPETLVNNVLPTLRVFNAGVQLTF